MEKALFDWPIVLQYDLKAKYRSISREFSGTKFFQPSVRLTNQKQGAFVSRSINQSNRSISFRLLFLFCSRVFISWSYENRSKYGYQWHTIYTGRIYCRQKNLKKTLHGRAVIPYRIATFKQDIIIGQRGSLPVVTAGCLHVKRVIFRTVRTMWKQFPANWLTSGRLALMTQRAKARRGQQMKKMAA